MIWLSQSFPTIEKDSAVRKSKCGNSSSTSREDGSSSRDSDSGTSSDSDADCAKASTTIVNNMNLTLGSEKTAVPIDAETESHSVNEVSQVEQKSLSDPISGEVDGESAQSKRQVSPVKLYRAALLKSHFADTILKAQEKTIRKGENQDPERSRLEKELLEKR